MPDKTRRQKGRRISQDVRRRAAGPRPATVPAGGAEAVRPAAPASRPRPAAPPAAVATPAAPVYAYFGRELRMIIILGTLILAAAITVALLTR